MSEHDENDRTDEDDELLEDLPEAVDTNGEPFLQARANAVAEKGDELSIVELAQLLRGKPWHSRTEPYGGLTGSAVQQWLLSDGTIVERGGLIDGDSQHAECLRRWVAEPACPEIATARPNDLQDLGALDAWVGACAHFFDLDLVHSPLEDRDVPNAELSQRPLDSDEARYVADFMRLVEGDTFALEVATVDWPEPHLPALVWAAFRLWDSQPSPDQIETAKGDALHDPRFFRKCGRCGRIQNAGHMHNRRVCQCCAEKDFRVIY